jgi:hypothetical protein
MALKINDLTNQTSAADNMQLETDIGGVTANKITLLTLYNYMVGKFGLGTASTKSSSSSDSVVASVHGTITAGCVAIFNDGFGTLIASTAALSAVALSGAYADLSGKPALGSAAYLAAGVASGAATLGSDGYVPMAQLNPAIVNGLEFAGVWDANANSPAFTSGVGTKGYLYKVSTSGTTALNGITQWYAGDYAVFDGTSWQKIDGLATEVRTVAGRTGDIVLTVADIGGLGTAATKNSSNNSLSILAAISGTVLAGNMPVLADNVGTIADTGISKSAFVTSMNQVGVKFNGFGDSLMAQSAYMPYTSTPWANVPAWAVSTPYTLNSYIYAGGNMYRCTVAGTSASSGSGPSGVGYSGITDGTATWIYAYPYISRWNSNVLNWAARYSNGALDFDMSQGYAGPVNSLLRMIITNPGTGYSNTPTLTLSYGATGYLTTDGAGHINGAFITQPGYSPGIALFTYTITDGTGTGATLSMVCCPSGTFGVTGCTTADMVARLPDAVASNVDIFVMIGGHNDIVAGTSYATITANLKNCIDTLVAAGKKVIILPIPPSTAFSTVPNGGQGIIALRVNRFLRAYAHKSSFANTKLNSVVFCDVNGYLTDGGSATDQPLGGTGGTSGAMTYDGTHWSCRAAQYVGYCLNLASQVFTGPPIPYSRREYSIFDGYDPVSNPGGNYFEALPWSATQVIPVGTKRNNSGNIYRCTTAGTTASSGGPTGTGTAITDGTVVWRYMFAQGLSTWQGTGGTMSASTGITYTGTIPNPFTLQHITTGSTGTVVVAQENPWSNGQAGKRMSMVFSLGSGSASDQWQLVILYGTLAAFGVTAADLNGQPFTVECEVELSGVANLTNIHLNLYDDVTATNVYEGNNTAGAGYHWINSAGEAIPIPNNGKILLQSQPMVLPANMTDIDLNIGINFDSSGGAGSATATMKFNYLAIKKTGVA